MNLMNPKDTHCTRIIKKYYKKNEKNLKIKCIRNKQNELKKNWIYDVYISNLMNG